MIISVRWLQKDKRISEEFDMDIAKLKIADVYAFWLDLDDQEFDRYELVSGSIRKNNEHQAIRFGLRKGDDEFEVVIRHDDEDWFFKSDTYDNPDEEFLVHLFSSKEEIVFVCSDAYEQIYFHFILA